MERLIRELARSESGCRQRRIRRARRTEVVAILGVDGSGKSTVSRRLASALSAERLVCLVGDTLEFFDGGRRKEIQPLITERIREALGRYAKSAESLRRYKIPKLGELLLRDQLLQMIRRWYSPDVIVLDGSPLLNLLAWTRLYRNDALDRATCSTVIRLVTGATRVAAPDRRAVYRSLPELAALKRLGLARLTLPDVVILLDVEPAVAIQRIGKRDERRQVHETREKLAELREGYRVVCAAVRSDFGSRVRVLDGAQALEELVSGALRTIGRSGEREVVRA